MRFDLCNLLLHSRRKLRIEAARSYYLLGKGAKIYFGRGMVHGSSHCKCQGNYNRVDERE